VISIVVETWNLRGVLEPLRELLAALEPQRAGAELIVTHGGIPSVLRRELDEDVPDIQWVELDPSAGYYDHKNRGFAAAHGDVVAFIDGDCAPEADWLAELTRPIVDGTARVVAGQTSYRGELAALANQLDFPYFHHDRARGTVRNFFANNVAFARDTFTGYPELAMFHGQCQVLGLQLLAANIAIHHAPTAHVIHAWPGGAKEWIEVRLLRGADTASLLPYVLRHYSPRGARIAAHLGRVPALAVLAARAITGTATALRHGPRARGLALVAGVTLVDAIGCAAGPAVYRAFA
jgi:Glycosyl transferase family 2